MLYLSNVLADRYGDWMGTLFLVGFWAAAMSSLVGVWNGVSLMFADFMGNVTGKTPDDVDSRLRRRHAGRALHPVAHLPADGDAVPGRAGLADPRLRGAGRLLHAVPRGDTALDPATLTARPREWRNKIVLQRSDGPVCPLAFAALAVNEIRKAIAGI